LGTKRTICLFIDDFRVSPSPRTDPVAAESKRLIVKSRLLISSPVGRFGFGNAGGRLESRLLQIG
jgi:hypothetical protein